MRLDDARYEIRGGAISTARTMIPVLRGSDTLRILAPEDRRWTGKSDIASADDLLFMVWSVTAYRLLQPTTNVLHFPIADVIADLALRYPLNRLTSWRITSDHQTGLLFMNSNFQAPCSYCQSDGSYSERDHFRRAV